MLEQSPKICQKFGFTSLLHGKYKVKIILGFLVFMNLLTDFRKCLQHILQLLAKG